MSKYRANGPPYLLTHSVTHSLTHSLTDLQCVSVCEPAGEGEGASCFHGAVAWMAHDLLALAK